MNKSINSFHRGVDNFWLSKIMLFRCIQILQDAIIITSMMKQPFGNYPFCSWIIFVTGKDKSQIMCSDVQHNYANSHSKIKCSTVSSIPWLQRTQLTTGMFKRFHVRTFLVFSRSFSNNQKNTLCLPWHRDFHNHLNGVGAWACPIMFWYSCLDWKIPDPHI
jgi:hypothetical protein